MCASVADSPAYMQPQAWRKKLLPDHRHDSRCVLMSFADAARYLTTTVQAIESYQKRRHLNGFPSIKLGEKTCRIRICLLDAWMEWRDECIRRGQKVH